jgi:flagellar basal body P-ring protein FlgI
MSTTHRITNRTAAARQTQPSACRWRQLKPAVLLCLLAIVVGCSNKKTLPNSKLPTRYQSFPRRTVPDYLKDTILEHCDINNIEPFPVSGFGLMSNLHGTGDTVAGTAVREYIGKQMIIHGFGSRLIGYGQLQPEDVFKDPSFAIVKVEGLIPPGARKHQRFDVAVSTLDGNSTSSLAHGILYRTDLKVNGANVQAPGYAIDAWASAEGPVFVNPTYALMKAPTNPEARMSLLRGKLLSGGIVLMDRPLYLRLRQPEMRLARTIEYRIDQAFQETSTSAAKDEAMIATFVPDKYGGDWEHYIQVVTHLFLNSSSEYAVVKARRLAEEAVKPDAPLLDISYCWEGMGPTILPTIAPLMTHAKQDVAFAAARAAAFLGDTAAQGVLIGMARTSGHQFQSNAVQTLAKLPDSPQINSLLRSLLDANETVVRIEAYRALAERSDSRVMSQEINDEYGRLKFVLDVVVSQGPPLIYAARSGIPRIAVIGKGVQVDTPVLFTAAENRFSINSDKGMLNVFYRGSELPAAVSIVSSPDLVELIARLGGHGAPGQPKLKFGYCDVVSLVQAMAEQNRLSAGAAAGRTSVAFMLQEAPASEQAIRDAPPIPEQAPAQPATLGAAVDSRTNAAAK